MSVAGLLAAGIFITAGNSSQPQPLSVQRDEMKVLYKLDKELRQVTQHQTLEYRVAIEAGRAALLDEKRAFIKKNAVYIMVNGAGLYNDPAFTGKKETLKRGQMLILKETLKNKAGKITGYSVKRTYEDSAVAGYLKATEVTRSVAALLNVKYPGVDYEPFIRESNYPGNPQVKVKGIYITTHIAMGQSFWSLVDQAKKSGINALVIDIKDDNEMLLFTSESAKKYNPTANGQGFKNGDAFMKKLKAKNMYLIARIVTFKSPGYANAHKDRAIIVRETGQLHSDSGMIWASPYDRELWNYNVGLAKEAAKLGFNEVQFDYVRFPASNGGKLDAKLDYRNALKESKSEAIQKFLIFAHDTLSKEKVYVSADVFGWTASEVNDVGIGQHWEALANVVDYMCPMIYPSHYGTGNYGLKVPDAAPYQTVFRCTADAKKRNANILTPAKLRPWIQDFTATWVKGHIKYGDNELRLQIKALKDQGVDEYILWNAVNRYHYGGLQ